MIKRNLLLMTKSPKERILNTFSGKKIDQIVFSPRIYYWYNENKVFFKSKKGGQKKHVPENYDGKSQQEIYDMLNASPRYVFETYFISLFDTIIESDAGVEIQNKRGKDRNEIIKIFKTPKGELTSRIKHFHIQEYPIKSLDDIEIMKIVLDNSTFQFNHKNYEKAKEMMGDSGVISEYIPRSPYMRLVVDYIGFVSTILLLRKHPKEIEEFINFIDSWNDQIFDVVNKSPLKIINFGENIDANLSPPPYFKKYLVPYYNKRVKELHKAGIMSHIHMDGSLKDLLPFLEDLPFDGLEALTAKPQGDVTLEELRDSIGSKILLDGIPSILFLNEYSDKQVLDFTKKVLDLFFPRLILGVSDEFPPNGNIRKLEMISEVIKDYTR
jgi:hypothetical protein